MRWTLNPASCNHIPQALNLTTMWSSVLTHKMQNDSHCSIQMNAVCLIRSQPIYLLINEHELLLLQKFCSESSSLELSCYALGCGPDMTESSSLWLSCYTLVCGPDMTESSTFWLSCYALVCGPDTTECSSLWPLLLCVGLWARQGGNSSDFPCGIVIVTFWLAEVVNCDLLIG